MGTDKCLYTYVPRDNTVMSEGLKSTAAADSGWEKYSGRVAKFKGYDPDSREDVLRWLDDTIPGFRRSYAISALDGPIPDNASEGLRAFRDRSTLIRIRPAAELLAAGVISPKAILSHRARGRRSTRMLAKNTGGVSRDWGRTSGRDRYLFSSMPHYFIETTGGTIPPEYLEEVR